MTVTFGKAGVIQNRGWRLSARIFSLEPKQKSRINDFVRAALSRSVRIWLRGLSDIIFGCRID